MDAASGGKWRSDDNTNWIVSVWNGSLLKLLLAHNFDSYI
jgi:hypothetical protein